MSTAPEFLVIDPLADIASLISDYETEAGVTLEPAAVERIILNAQGYQITLLKQQIQDAAVQNLVDFATGSFLDYLGANLGVARLAAAYATAAVTLTLTSSPSPLTIPQGTRFSTNDGLVIFALTADVDVPALTTTATATAQCSVTGAIGNDYAIGTVTTIMDPQPYLTVVTNTAITSGGSDLESDEGLRVRVKLAPASFSVAGSRQAYQYHALTASALLIACAVPDTDGDGIVRLYPLMADGSATPVGILDAVTAACSKETVRPLSDTVTVIAPTRVNFTLTVTIVLYIGVSQATTTAAINAGMATWAESKRQSLGNDIIESQVIAAIHDCAPGDIYSVTLSGFSDITITPIQYAYLNANPTITYGAAVLG